MKCKTVQSDKKWNASEEKENKIFVFHVIPCHLPVPHHNLELQGNYIRRLFRLISVFKLCAGNNCHKQKHSFYILNATQFDVRPNFWRHVFQLITLRN